MEQLYVPKHFPCFIPFDPHNPREALPGSPFNRGPHEASIYKTTRPPPAKLQDSRAGTKGN